MAAQDESIYIIVSSDNFCDTEWKNQISISFSRCLAEVTLAELSNCFYTLRNASFSNLTTVSNLKTILTLCPNINTITFNEALIDEYRQLPPPSTAIVHDRISELKIIRPLELSKNEYWFLDFFTNQVDLTNIASFSFYCFTTIGGANTLLNDANERDPNVSRPGITLQSVDVMDTYSGFDKTNTVLNFIRKYQKTLKAMWIGRPGFDVGSASPDLDTLRLNLLNVSLGSSGVNFLLDTQMYLETLNLVTKLSLKEHNSSSISKLMAVFFNCIRSNAETLKAVQIAPTLISREFSRDDLLVDLRILESLKVDCEIFSDCKHLHHLCLSLRAYHHEMDMWMDIPPILQGTKLVNIHKVPTNLTELYFPVEEFSLDELEKLASKFSQFTSLRKFYFGTSCLNVFNTFLIRSPWIKDLINLPAIQSIVFHNGIMQDIETTTQLIDRYNSSPWNRKSITLIYTVPRYTFDFLETDFASYEESI